MIITISRQLGSQGDEIATRIVAGLDLEFVDRVYVRGAAREAGIAEALLQRLLYEGQPSVAADILNSLGAPRTQKEVSAQSVSPLLNVFAPMLPPTAMTLEEAAHTIGDVIRQVAARDNVLVLGQAGQVLLKDHLRACHVQLIAPLDVRVERVARRDRVSAAVARRRVRASDDARATFLARYYGVRWQDPLLYHLVINTGLTSVEDAVSLITHAARTCAT
jgi:CMP/dCMP kinase